MRVKVTIELASKLYESFEIDVPKYDAGVIVSKIEGLFIDQPQVFIDQHR